MVSSDLIKAALFFSFMMCASTCFFIGLSALDAYYAVWSAQKYRLAAIERAQGNAEANRIVRDSLQYGCVLFNEKQEGVASE